jgi:putative phage-type endonuclease
MGLPAEKLEVRHLYLGGTEAAAVVGLSRRKTLLEVWANKTGAVPREEVTSEAAKVGTYLEEYVARRFTEETGKKVRRVNDTLFHKQYPFLGANLDRRVIGENAILEAKTTTAWLADEWKSTEIPPEYICQCLHYLAVTGAARCYLAVLIGNQEFKWMVIERDEAAIASLVRREVEFWNRFVVPGVMPKMVRAADSDVLYKLFPEPPDSSLMSLPSEANEIIELIISYQADEKNLKALIGQKKNEIKMMLGETEIGLTDKYRASWKVQTRDDGKKSRVLRISQRKEAI